MEACGHGLGINERLIKEDQQEYHDEMKANYRDLTRELSAIMHETVRWIKNKHHTQTFVLCQVVLPSLLHRRLATYVLYTLITNITQLNMWFFYILWQSINMHESHYYFSVC